MVVRRKRPHKKLSASARLASPVAAARVIIWLEQAITIFAAPLLIAALFLILAVFGVFARLYPWLHFTVLAIFTAFFFHRLGKSLAQWRRPSTNLARRRVEQASGLAHRPLDVIDDHPFTSEVTEPSPLWQAHLDAALQNTMRLRWPRWNLRLAEHDPYRLRYILAALLIVGCITGWGMLGGRMIAAINPALGRQLTLFNPTLDAWITPPDYTGLPPIMIATPAGLRHDGDVIDVPEGSKLSAHLLEQGGDVPALLTDHDKTAFTTDVHNDYVLDTPLANAETLTLRRGWQKLGSWHIHIVPDRAPQIALTAPPAASERKSLRLAYEASDDYAVTSVIARIAPRQSLPGVSNDPLEIPLAEPQAKQVKRVSFLDLTDSLWAGTPVTITLIARDAAGHSGVSAPAEMTLPERQFFNPVARILIDERKKLIAHGDDTAERNDIANVMAGIAHQPASYNADPLVLLALRGGAVRLVLDRSQAATDSVNVLLWQTAIRVEDGSTGSAERNLRQAQKDLADALDRNASQQEIQGLIDRLHQALAQYLAELATRTAAQPATPDALGQMTGAQTNMLTPADLERMLNHLRDLSAAGARDAAKQELAQLQQILENIRPHRPGQLTAAQQQMMQELAALNGLQKRQQQLLDQTFRQSQAGRPDPQLAPEQNELDKQLQALKEAMQAGEQGKSSVQSQGLDKSDAAMQAAGGALGQGNARGAITHQNEALQGLQQAMQALAKSLRDSLGAGQGEGGESTGRDPFGHQADVMDDSVKVPDQLQVQRVREILNELQRRSGDTNRSKTERDYIDRLLQDF